MYDITLFDKGSMRYFKYKEKKRGIIRICYKRGVIINYTENNKVVLYMGNNYKRNTITVSAKRVICIK